MFLPAMLGSLINLNGPGRYIHWGFIQISVGQPRRDHSDDRRLRAAIFLPFPKRSDTAN